MDRFSSWFASGSETAMLMEQVGRSHSQFVKTMHYPIIEVTLRQICDILLASRRGIISDTEALNRIRAQIFRPSVQDAASRSGDTVFAFALRGLHRILSDRAE